MLVVAFRTINELPQLHKLPYSVLDAEVSFSVAGTFSVVSLIAN